MKPISRKLALVGILAVGVLFAGLLVYRALDSGLAMAIDDKSAKTSPATVLSVGRTRRGNVGDTPQPEELYKICFVIDSMDQVQGQLRPQYEAAEHERNKTLGPRCKITGNSVAASLRAGDKIQVVYLIENEFRIDVVSVRALGVDLGPEGASYSGSGEIHE